MTLQPAQHKLADGYLFLKSFSANVRNPSRAPQNSFLTIGLQLRRGEAGGKTSACQAGGFLMPSSSVLSGFKDGKAVGVVDEDAPEEPGSQDSVEPLYKGILLGCGAEEGDAGQFE